MFLWTSFHTGMLKIMRKGIKSGPMLYSKVHYFLQKTFFLMGANESNMSHKKDSFRAFLLLIIKDD